MPTAIITPPGISDASKRTVGSVRFQDSVTFQKYSCETGGEYTECLITLNPGGGNPLHYHHTYTESFTPISGKLGLQLGSDTLHLEKAQSVTVQRKQRHRFFNDSSESIEFHVKIAPGSPEFEKSIYIAYGLANDGLTDSKGIPKNFLDLCIIAVLGDIRLAGLIGLMMPFMFIGAWYARWSGHEDTLLKKYFR